MANGSHTFLSPLSLSLEFTSEELIYQLGLKLWMLKPGVHLPDLQFKALHTLAMLLLSSHFLTTPILHSTVTGPLASLKNPISLSA